ncbi:MAG: InlB B-repeat-containing protein [Schaalia turicensis]
MRESTKRAISLLIAPLVFLGMMVTAIVAPQSASAEGQVRIEVLPELFINQQTKALFDSPQQAIGAKRTLSVYGGAPPAQVLETWKNIAFQVYDGDGNLVETTKGTVGDPDRWSGAKYLGPYPQGKTYTVKVDNSTVPEGYHSWFTAEKSGYPRGETDMMTVSSDNYSATNPKENANPIAETRFHLDIASVAYAKNADVAKDLFVVENDNVTGINTKYTKGTDYVIKTVAKDGTLPQPTQAEVANLTDEGYMPEYFYFMYKDQKSSLQNIRARKGNFSYLKWWEGNDGVNTFEKFKYSSVFVTTLNQRVPEVKFYKAASEGAEPEVLTSMQVYYERSAAQNCLSDGTTCLPKELPAAPAKEGYAFKEWNTKADGSGDVFDADTVVKGDLAVYPIYVVNTPPVLEVKDATITAGEQLDLHSLITKAADEQDGANLADKVVIEQGNFDSSKAGAYEVKFTLTDSNGESVTAIAKITVKEAAQTTPTNTTEPTEQKKTTVKKSKPNLPVTGSAVAGLLGVALACGLAGAAISRRAKRNS